MVMIIITTKDLGTSMIEETTLQTSIEIEEILMPEKTSQTEDSSLVTVVNSLNSIDQDEILMQEKTRVIVEDILIPEFNNNQISIDLGGILMPETNSLIEDTQIPDPNNQSSIDPEETQKPVNSSLVKPQTLVQLQNCLRKMQQFLF